MIFITKALEELGVNEFTLRGTPTNEEEFQEYFSKIVGEDSAGHAIESKDCPVTWLEINTKAQELEIEYNNNEYQRQRALEYPGFAAQFDLLYHGGYEAWKTEIDKVKEKYPKP